MTKPQSNLAQLRDFLSYLATVKGDLSNITAPPFVLSPKSVTEIPAHWAEHQSLFLAPTAEPDPAKRALLVLENFLCSLKRQVYTAASADSDGGIKKPLNAFLGELFLGAFVDDAEDGSTTQLISEQVSHHPPVTACVLYNRARGISSSGYVAQQTIFSVSRGVVVKQVGHAIIRDEVHGESHLMTLPTMVIKNLMLGAPYPELTGTCYLVSSSGFRSTVVFEGKRTSLVGRSGDRPLFEVAGQWNGALTVKDLQTQSVVEEFHVDKVERSELQTKPVSQQSPWESRRAWFDVANGIREGNLQKVSAAKTDIEEGQRAIRRAEKSADVEWPRMFFRNTDHDDEYEVLAGAIPDPEVRALQLERTGASGSSSGFEEEDEAATPTSSTESLSMEKEK
ncbi:KES1, partial [Apiospora arundinis]